MASTNKSLEENQKAYNLHTLGSISHSVKKFQKELEEKEKKTSKTVQ